MAGRGSGTAIDVMYTICLWKWMERVRSNGVGQMKTGKCRVFFDFLALVGLLPAGDVNIFDTRSVY